MAGGKARLIFRQVRFRHIKENLGRGGNLF